MIIPLCPVGMMGLPIIFVWSAWLGSCWISFEEDQPDRNDDNKVCCMLEMMMKWTTSLIMLVMIPEIAIRSSLWRKSALNIMPYRNKHCLETNNSSTIHRSSLVILEKTNATQRNTVAKARKAMEDQHHWRLWAWVLPHLWLENYQVWLIFSLKLYTFKLL